MLEPLGIASLGSYSLSYLPKIYFFYYNLINWMNKNVFLYFKMCSITYCNIILKHNQGILSWGNRFIKYESLIINIFFFSGRRAANAGPLASWLICLLKSLPLHLTKVSLQKSVMLYDNKKKTKFGQVKIETMLKLQKN